LGDESEDIEDRERVGRRSVTGNRETEVTGGMPAPATADLTKRIVARPKGPGISSNRALPWQMVAPSKAIRGNAWHRNSEG
jgi:hypothetical protein